MKVLAVYGAGFTYMILPKKNEIDLDDLPEEVRNAINLIPIEQIDEAPKVSLAAESLN
ncbi:MAG: hypothetical protein JSU83_13295 [Deltaproteobacteria bacterium]|nr:MAG: hypothetical protein JSU83_13295 [Deltaproteobacteria bacterium]